ncbi:MAG: hypothetical protein RIA69_07910 [Cyclobacteriaceae bacterium]
MSTLKRIVVFLLFFQFHNFQSLAQESPSKELGISMTGLDNFSFLFKKETGENKFRRYSGALFNIVAVGESDDIINQIRLGLAIGFEKRKSISDDVQFVHGWRPSMNFIFNSGNSFFNPGIGYILGFQHNVADNFWIGIEAIPSANMIWTPDSAPTVGIEFNTTSIAITALHRF